MTIVLTNNTVHMTHAFATNKCHPEIQILHMYTAYKIIFALHHRSLTTQSENYSQSNIYSILHNIMTI